MATYTMKSNGSTRGAKTNKLYIFSEGDEIEAPTDEFPHLGGGDYEVRPMRVKTTMPPEREKTTMPPEKGELGGPATVSKKTKAKKAVK